MKPRFILTCALLALTAMLLSACATHPGIALTKTAVPTSFSQAGDVITYTYFITNTGDQTLMYTELTDDSVTISCQGKTIFVGGTMTCTGTYTITAADMLAGKVDTTATAGAWAEEGGCCGGTSKIQATAHVEVPLILVETPEGTAGLVLIKSADTEAFNHIGQEIGYSYLLTNVGTAPILDPIVITDDRLTATCPPLPADGLLPGDSLTCTGTYAITDADVRAGVVVNTASARAGIVISNTDTLEVPLAVSTGLMLEKLAKPASYQYTGDEILYTLRITNTGNVPLTGPITINDKMLTNWKCTPDPFAELAAGESMTCTQTLIIADASAGINYKNTATVSLMYGTMQVTSNEASVTVLYIPPPTVDCSTYNGVGNEAVCFQNGCIPDSYGYGICSNP